MINRKKLLLFSERGLKSIFEKYKLVSYYSLEQNGVDDYGANNMVDVGGVPIYVVAQNGYSLSTDSVNTARLYTNNLTALHFDKNQPFTVSFRTISNSTVGVRYLLSRVSDSSSSWVIQYSGLGVLKFILYKNGTAVEASTASVSFTETIGESNHWICSYNGDDTFTIYLNGVQQSIVYGGVGFIESDYIDNNSHTYIGGKYDNLLLSESSIDGVGFWRSSIPPDIADFIYSWQVREGFELSSVPDTATSPLPYLASYSDMGYVEGDVSATVNYPADIAIGDLMILHVSAYASPNSLTPPSAPTGWTKFSEGKYGNVQYGVNYWYKYADAGDIGSITITNPSVAALFGRIFTFRGVPTGVAPEKPYQKGPLFVLNLESVYEEIPNNNNSVLFSIYMQKDNKVITFTPYSWDKLFEVTDNPTTTNRSKWAMFRKLNLNKGAVSGTIGHTSAFQDMNTYLTFILPSKK